MPITISFVESLLFLLFAGGVSGILSSAPVGPANLWIVSALAPPSKKTRNIIAYVLGIIIVDLVYAQLAFKGYSSYFQGTESERWLGVIGGLGLIVIGALECKNLYSRNDNNANDTPSTPGSRGSCIKDFAVGAFICGSNPVFIMFWLMVANNINEFGITNLDSNNAIYVLIGIVAGDALWYSGFTKTVKMGLTKIPNKIIYYLRLSIAASIIALGLMALNNYL